MSERIVNLDNTPRPTIVLEIAGQQFRIRRIVTGVRQLWVGFVKESVEHLERLGEYERFLKKAGEKDKEETERRTAEITKQVDQFAARKIDRLLEIIELMLVKNGYEFDREWWVQNAEEADYREFITNAMLKDQPDASKKNEGAGEGKSTGPE